jgi:hypothetical protein
LGKTSQLGKQEHPLVTALLFAVLAANVSEFKLHVATIHAKENPAWDLQSQYRRSHRTSCPSRERGILLGNPKAARLFTSMRCAALRRFRFC